MDIMDISGTIHLLGDLLGQVLIEQESKLLFDIEEQIRMAARDLRSEQPLISARGKRDPGRIRGPTGCPQRSGDRQCICALL